ncbi:hypothetical protein [Lentibacillus salinarum]
MADRIHKKLENADQLAEHGLKQCHLESERNVWLYSFSDPFTTAKNVAHGDFPKYGT